MTVFAILPMFILLLAFFGISLAKNTLKWESYSVSGSGSSQYISTTASFKSEPTKHKLRILRFIKGHPTSHIFLLPPAPGQGALYWEDKLSKLSDAYGHDFVLYAVDLRGTPKSSCFSERPDFSKRELKGDQKSTDGKLMLNQLSVTGLAQDLIRIIEKVKAEPGFKGKVFMHGQSFGTLIAQAALKKSPSLFAAVLFESYLPTASWPNISNDNDFLELCETDEFCKSTFPNVNIDQLRSIMATISNPKYNKCTAILIGTLKKDFALGSVDSESTDWLRIQEFLQPFLMERINVPNVKHPAVLVLPFLSAVMTCENEVTFRDKILPFMLSKSKGANWGKYETFGSENKGINKFSNAFLMMKEVFNMKSERDHACNTSSPLGLASPCMIYRNFRNWAKNKNKNLERKADYESIGPTDVKLFFVGGALDLLTPTAAMEQIYNKAGSKSKRLLKVGNSGHHPLLGEKCVAEIGAEFLDKGLLSETDKCLKANEKVDWKSIKEVSSWWGNGSTAATIEKDKGGRESSDNGLTNFIIISVIGGVIVLCAVTFYFLNRKYRFFNRKNELP